MYSQLTAIIIALAAAPIMVSAHGKISLVTGDLGGNGTGLGIQGAVVPGMGPNYKTEVDTTVFWSKDISTDNDIGFTESGSGNNQLTDITDAMAQSGSTLPQVSSSGGSINTTWHVVTDDGCGPVEALIDESASGKWSTAKSAAVTTDMPGSAGDCPSDLANDSGNENKVRRALRRGLEKMGLISKRAANVDKDFVSISFPSTFLYLSEFMANITTLQRVCPSPSPLVPAATAPSTASATCAWSSCPTTTPTVPLVVSPSSRCRAPATRRVLCALVPAPRS